MNRTMLPPPDNPGTKQRGRWQKGQSGNPAGRTKGSRHPALVALDTVGQDAAVGILQSVITAALAGDMRAAGILLDRIWPARKGRPVHLDLPAIKTGADLAQALSAVVAAVAAGQLTPEEASGVSAVLEAQRRALELGELEDRIAALEDRFDQ